MMTLTIELDEKIERLARSSAASNGQSLDDYIAEVLLKHAMSQSLAALRNLWALADQEQWKSDSKEIVCSDDEMYLQ
jgi:hypothetical protein